jgi:hypothetical protein
LDNRQVLQNGGKESCREDAMGDHRLSRGVRRALWCEEMFDGDFTVVQFRGKYARLTADGGKRMTELLVLELRRRRQSGIFSQYETSEDT